MKERQQIEWTYDHFRDWVNKESSVYNFGESQDWTTHGLLHLEKLY
jgi:hypothetical protein